MTTSTTLTRRDFMATGAGAAAGLTLGFAIPLAENRALAGIGQIDEINAWVVVKPDETVVMHLSNLKPIKRPLDFVASMETTLRRDPKLVYVVVGDGVLREPMKAACRRLNLAHRLRTTGWVDYETVPDYVNLADIVVMMSEGEGMARVYLETQACGRVLLSSDIPQAREVVVHGETGLLFRLGDTDDLAAKILQAAADPALRAAIGRKARQQAERLYDIDAAVGAYLALFRDVIGHHRAEPVPG